MEMKLLLREGIKKVNGKILTYKNTDFGIPFKNEKSSFEFIHIESGLGFSGNGKRNLDSLKSKEKDIGVRMFWKIVKSNKNIKGGLKSLKDIEIHNNTFHDRVQLLNKETELRMKKDMRMSLVISKLSIDIFDLEYQLKNMGYNDDGLSIDSFITEKWGKEISKRIKELI